MSKTQKLAVEMQIDGGAIRTVTSAERAIIRLSVDIRWYGPEHPTADTWANEIEAALIALHVTTGEPRNLILERLSDKIDRSFTRQERESAAMAKRLGLV